MVIFAERFLRYELLRYRLISQRFSPIQKALAGDSMWNWLQTNAVALIGHVLTFLGLIAAAITVAWQLRRQHQSSLALQRVNAREALKLRIYEGLVQQIRRLSDAQIMASMYAFGIPSAVENYQHELAAGHHPPGIRQRAPEFSDLHFRAGNEVAELLVEFESWSIAFPSLHVFQVALNAAEYNVQEAFWPLFSALLRALPMDPPQGETGKPSVVPPPLTLAELEGLKAKVVTYKEAMDEVGCYLHDLAIEAQNNLLFGLFEREVPRRQPLDPRYRVISTEPLKVEELIRYFENETPWGKNQASIAADVVAETQAQVATKVRQ